MNDLRQAAQQALEALYAAERFAGHETYPAEEVSSAITALRAALAQAEPVQADEPLSMSMFASKADYERAQQQAEPYAWHYTNNAGASVWHRGPSTRLDADMQAARDYPRVHKVTPLYTASPQRKPLTDAEIEIIHSAVGNS